MKKAKLFKNGNSQAVRLPKEYRFEGGEVYVKTIGNTVVLIPEESPWESTLSSLSDFSDDFLSDRLQPEVQERDNLSA